MKTTQILKREHLIIKTYLMKTAGLLAAPAGADAEIRGCFEFFVDFADRFHHAKEEGIYFPWMVSQEPGVEHGPVAVMLHEHDVCRRALRESCAAWEAGDRAGAARAFAGFQETLREHIFKEDNILYSIADRLAESCDGDMEMMPQFENVARDLKAVAERWDATPIHPEVAAEAEQEACSPFAGCGGH